MLILTIVGFLIMGFSMGVISVDKENGDNEGHGPLYALAVVGAVVFIGSFCFYGQDAGEVILKRNFGGSLAGYTEEPGFHVKAPWQTPISYDVRSNLISLYRDAEYSYDGGAAEGACVTINDKGGATADVDVQVVYSLDADAAMQLYINYGTQEHFTSTVVLNDVRAVAREVAGQFPTITLLTSRGEFTKALRDALTEKWEPLGLDVDNVSIQNIQYDSELTKSFTAAQAAEVAKAKAENEQETARVQAETKRIEAEGEAAANKVLTESLTPEVLQQRYIDALKEIGAKGNLVVVPEGSTPMIQVGDAE